MWLPFVIFRYGRNGRSGPSYKDGSGERLTPFSRWLILLSQVSKMGTVGLLTNGKMGTIASFPKCQKWARLGDDANDH